LPIARSSTSGPMVTSSRTPGPVRSRATRATAPRELAHHCPVHEEPVGGRTRLPDVAELRRDRPVDGAVQVGVVEHHERINHACTSTAAGYGSRRLSNRSA
jgi:hypothetical protein